MTLLWGSSLRSSLGFWRIALMVLLISILPRKNWMCRKEEYMTLPMCWKELVSWRRGLKTTFSGGISYLCFPAYIFLGKVMFVHLPNPMSECVIFGGWLTANICCDSSLSLSLEFCLSFRGGQIPNHGDSQSRLRSDIYNLTSKENMLDELIRNAEHELRQLSEDKRFAYITYQDLRSIPCYANETVMAIKAPPEAKLEVPHPSAVCFKSSSAFCHHMYIFSVVLSCVLICVQFVPEWRFANVYEEHQW